jgi:Ca2+/Na+ antiporter
VILGWVRLLLLALVVLTVVYLLVSIYSRSVRREKLEKRYDAGGVEGDRDAYIAQGMAAYERGLRKRLIWLVIILPLAAMAATIYVVNWD